MSIVTKKGDGGYTELMYGRKINKNHPQVEAYGMVDELGCCLGLIRPALSSELHAPFLELILSIQGDLVLLMGELATSAGDLDRYEGDGFKRINLGKIDFLSEWATKLENRKFVGWSTPGTNEASARTELARAVCRRAERAVCKFYASLFQENRTPNKAEESQTSPIIIYLNRLSDVLWLLARHLEDN